MDVRPRIALQLGKHFQSAAAPRPTHLVAAVGDVLHFAKDELRHDQLRVDHPRFDEVGDSAVDEGARIDDQGPIPLEVAGELDVRNHEAEIVLGLQQK